MGTLILESPHLLTSSLLIQALVLIVSSLIALKSYRKKEFEAEEVAEYPVNDHQSITFDDSQEAILEQNEEIDSEKMYREVIQEEKLEAPQSISIQKKEKVIVIGDAFSWPIHAPILENPTTSSKQVSTELSEKLKNLGIYRDIEENEPSRTNVERAARECGKELAKILSWQNLDLGLSL